MKKTLLIAGVAGFFGAVSSQAAVTITQGSGVFQGFESSGDTWNFTSDPALFNTETTGNVLDIDGVEDVWAPIERIDNAVNVTNGGPHSGTQYWGMQDLENTNGGQSGFLSLDFEEISFVTGTTGKSITFYHYAFGYDNGDDLGYELVTTTNGSSPTLTGTPSVVVVNGSSDFTTAGWIKTTINLDDDVTNVAFSLLADQNGDDYGGFDSVSISAIPEPSAAVLGLLGLGAAALRRRR